MSSRRMDDWQFAGGVNLNYYLFAKRPRKRTRRNRCAPAFAILAFRLARVLLFGGVLMTGLSRY